MYVSTSYLCRSVAHGKTAQVKIKTEMSLIRRRHVTFRKLISLTTPPPIWLT